MGIKFKITFNFHISIYYKSFSYKFYYYQP